MSMFATSTCLLRVVRMVKAIAMAERTIHEFTALLEPLDRGFDEVVDTALLPACGDIGIVVEHAAVVSPLGGISVPVSYTHLTLPTKRIV